MDGEERGIWDIKKVEKLNLSNLLSFTFLGTRAGMGIMGCGAGHTGGHGLSIL